MRIDFQSFEHDDVEFNKLSNRLRRGLKDGSIHNITGYCPWQFCEMSYFASKQNRQKYFIRYFCIEPTLVNNWKDFFKCNNFLNEHLGIDDLGFPFNAILEETIKNPTTPSGKRWHIFKPTAEYVKHHTQLKPIMVANPHIGAVSLELAERYLEIHLGDILSTGDHTDKVIKRFEQDRMWDEANKLRMIS